jgi:hypothetical protein
MNRFAKKFTLVLTILAVPITLMMAGVIVLTVAFHDFGIRGRWRLSDIVFMVCGMMYPILAAVAFKKARKQTDSQFAWVWTLLPVPFLLIIMVMLARFFMHI